MIPGTPEGMRVKRLLERSYPQGTTIYYEAELEPIPESEMDCYCTCHSIYSSRRGCLHCEPESFKDRRDPYCETDDQFQKRMADGEITDTEMLDFVIENRASLWNTQLSDRETIKSAMRRKP